MFYLYSAWTLLISGPTWQELLRSSFTGTFFVYEAAELNFHSLRDAEWEGGFPF